LSLLYRIIYIISPRHVARLVTRLAAPLVVDYSASRRLVVDNSASRRLFVDYFASITRPGASARRAARHAARRAARRRLLRLAQARRRLLRLHRASGCLGTSRDPSRGLSRRSSSTTPPRAGSSSTTSALSLVWVPRHIGRLIACRRQLRLHRATGCLGTSHGSSRGSSSTTPC
jgi:hypothetical protein